MYICKDCFLDEELRSEINANAVINGVCDVCGKEGKLMDFSDFHGFFNALLSLFSLKMLQKFYYLILYLHPIWTTL